MSRGWRSGVVVALLGGISVLGAQTRADVLRLVGRTVSATVTSVVDGDTVRVRLASGGQTLTVRLDGIDTPETGEPFSAQARNAARVLLFDRAVTLKGTDIDRYDRLVARITVDGKDSSRELVRLGLACHFTRYSSDALLAAAETDARSGLHGFWAVGAQRPACVAATTVATARGPVSGPFHGNTESHVYHSASCRNYNCKNCTAVFQTAAAAEQAKFRPAGDCLSR
jgi:micrococcal nuclease